MICDPLKNPRDPQCNTRMTENLDSRKHRVDQRGETWELHYVVQGTNDECLIEERLEHPAIGLQASFNGIPRDTHVLRNIGHETWDVVATYAWTGSRASMPLKVENQSYSTRGGRIHLTKSFESISRFPNILLNDEGRVAPNLGGAINWDGERVKGVDIIAPNLVYSESYIVSKFDIFTAGEKSKFNIWSDLTGKVHGNRPVDPLNLTKEEKGFPNFRYWKIGEVLLGGVTLRQTSAQLFEVTFEFLISKNKKVIIPESVKKAAVGPQQPPVIVPATVDVEGWDLTWFQYAKVDEDTGNGNVVKTLPTTMYIEGIYERANFFDLGIGVGIPPFGQATDPDCDDTGGHTTKDFEAAADLYCNPPALGSIP